MIFHVNKREATRDNGSTMRPKQRHYVDPDTGELRPFETTKEAKRRHQKSGGAQWKPTTGQVNAADIWNKQEEKIKRDKEREERKKRQRIRDAEKEVRQREIQQELLQKGRITVEDTWGKVAASQNRLHKFFSKPKQLTRVSAQGRCDSETDSGDDDDDSKASAKPRIKPTDNTPNLTERSRECDFNTFEATSPLTQRSPMRHGDHIQGSQLPDHEDTAGQKLMPPPPGPLLRQSQRIAAIAGSQPASSQLRYTGSDPKPPIRSPLSELTVSDTNVRAKERPDPEEENQKVSSPLFLRSRPPVSTQIVSETLAGLSSQDFADDFAEETADKENSSPSKSSEAISHELSSDQSGCPSPRSPVAHDDGTSYTEGRVDENNSEDDFDDDDIDNETLMSLAATQRIKNEFFTNARASPSSCSSQPLSRSSTTTPLSELLVQEESWVTSPTLRRNPQNVFDSFAMSGMDDSDLLQAMEDFEDDVLTDEYDDHELLAAVEEFEENNSECSPPRKRRRVLPWIKNPIDMTVHGSQLEKLQDVESFEDSQNRAFGI